MWKIEIDKTLRVIDLRLAKYCHEVAERLSYPAQVKRFCDTFAGSMIDTDLHISADEFPGHSMTLSHPKLYSIIRDLDELSKIDLYGMPFSIDNPGLARLGRIYYNCTGFQNVWMDPSLEAIEKVFNVAIEHLLDFVTGRGAMATMKRYTRRCRRFAGDYSIDAEDLVKAARGCNLSVEGMTHWEILEKFPYDCFRIDEELKKMGKL